MSDFGANIFDDGPAPTERPPAKRKARSKKTAPAAAELPAPTADLPAAPAEPLPAEVPAPTTVAEVQVNTAQRVHDDVQEVVFRPRRSDPARVQEEPEPQPTPIDVAPTDDAPRAREDRPRREDHDGPAPRPAERHQRREERRRDDAPRAEHREPTRPGHHRHERREHRHERPRSAPGAASARVALLVDLPALEAEARGRGGELAVTRLRAGLAAGSPIETAVCFASGRGRRPHGFEVIDAGDPLTAGIRFAAKATELAARGVHLVLVPASDAMLELARMLRGNGHSIELAGFVSREDDATPTRRLGRECLFVP